MDTVRARR